MLIKLIKHDFISLFKRISLTWLIFSILFLIAFVVAKTIRSVEDTYKIIFITISFTIVFLGFTFSGLLSSFGWFEKKMFSTQGYLTHTLPAKTSTIVLSKIISTLVLSTLGFILAILCSTIISVSLVRDLLHGMNSDFPFYMTPITEIIKDVFSEIGIKIAIGNFLKTLAFIMMVYFSISVAQLVNFGSRSFMAIIIFIILSVVFGSLSYYIIDLFGNVNYNPNLSVMELNRNLNRSIYFGYISNSIQVIIFWLGTMGICSRYLNLKG